MVFLKACPKCSGDAVEGEDEDGYYVKCLLCSRYLVRKPVAAQKAA